MSIPHFTILHQPPGRGAKMGHTTRLLMDGKELSGVREFSYRCAVGDVASMTVTFLCSVETRVEEPPPPE